MTIPNARWISWLMRVILAGTPLLAGCSLSSLFPSNHSESTEKEVIAGTPGKYSVRVSQFVFFSDFEINKHLPIFKELSVLREHVYRELRLSPSSTEVFVYLFEDKEQYEKFMQAKYPYLPKRRAFFVAQPRRLGGTEDLMVYTYWGNRIQQDLRHELTHALLHCVLKDVPLWLDEGLAEYFEVPNGWHGVNPQHIEQLRQAGVKFDLNRLENLKDVQQMTPSEYREAWAWVHLMLRSSPQAKQVLVQYLQELRTNPYPGLLRPRLAQAFVNLEDTLVAHLDILGDRSNRNDTSKR